MNSRNLLPKPALDSSDIARLLLPYRATDVFLPPEFCAALAMYLQTLLKWNAKTNLTAIRDPEEIVKRHFGESFFAAQHLGECQELLDFGSGAGFPGLPIQLFRPDLRVTLAESQNKKAAFLREVVRSLNLDTEVWANRVEAMPVSRMFDVVTLRAVDNMGAAIQVASLKARQRIVLLTTTSLLPETLDSFMVEREIPVPTTDNQRLLLLTRTSVKVP